MSVAGSWNLKIATPLGEQKAQLVLVEDGGTVTGTATSGDETIALDAIRVDGQRLSWEQRVTRPFPAQVTFDVVFDGDTAMGTAKPGMFPSSEVRGTRA